MIETFQATVVIAPIYFATKIAQWLQQEGRTLDSVRLIMFTGEQFFKDVRILWNSAYPNAQIAPWLYGSVELGPIGLPADPPRIGGNHDTDPVYRLLKSAVHMEILDAAGNPITRPGVKGSVVCTHLIKRLQPLLRYPVGDIAAWEQPGETFKLYGRESVSLKISTCCLDLVQLSGFVARHVSEKAEFQNVVRRTNGANVLVYRIAAPTPANVDAIRDALERDMLENAHNWAKDREAGMIAPVEIEFCEFNQLVTNPVSGKLKNFVEERFE